MMYVSQIIMLYTLNLYSAECWLYLNKTRRKKNNDKQNCIYIKRKTNDYSSWLKGDLFSPLYFSLFSMFSKILYIFPIVIVSTIYYVFNLT